VPARFTNLERTLIDITVRPVYAGGVFEVAKAFALAKDRVSINRLVAMLRKLDFAYPYHQAIGYYLERADYKPSQIDLIRRLPIENDFYLMHEMGDTRYVSNWRLAVPEGF
jgi:predicted transcriptional regulator of viral defense system